MSADNLDSSLRKLAKEIIEKATGPEVSLEEKLAALKTAGAYVVAAKRVKAKVPDDDGDTFDSFRRSVDRAGVTQ